MTRIPRDGQPDLIRWQPGDTPDWATPDSVYGDHAYCGNCGLDTPGCGCPRDLLRDAFAAVGRGDHYHATEWLATRLAEMKYQEPPPVTAASNAAVRASAARATLHMAVYAGDNTQLGVTEIAWPPRYGWQDGRLVIDYGPVTVVLRKRGKYEFALLIANSWMSWHPVLRLILPPPSGCTAAPELRPGDTVTVDNACMSVDFTGGPNDPAIAQP